MDYIAIMLWLAGAILGTLIFYYVVSAAVKNGIINAKRQTDKESVNK